MPKTHELSVSSPFSPHLLSVCIWPKVVLILHRTPSVPLLALGIFVPISSLVCKQKKNKTKKKVSYSTLEKSVRFRNGSLRQRWAATRGGFGAFFFFFFFSGGKRSEGQELLRKRTRETALPFPPPHTPPPPHCCACVFGRIRRQHGGGGAKAASSSWLRPHHAATRSGDSSRFIRTLNKYTIKYSAYIYFIYI